MGIEELVKNFNSIKVRLKREKRECVIYRDGFQFHKGTIKTCDVTMVKGIPQLFQFHKGTIKTFSECQQIVNDGYFNSIKVRLKLVNVITFR